MKMFSSLKWLVLGSALGLTVSCNYQKRDEGQKSQQMEQEEDRDDGDMCELESSDAKPIAEKREEVSSPELKAQLPIPTAVEKAQVSESKTSAAEPASVVEKAEEQTSAAV